MASTLDVIRRLMARGDYVVTLHFQEEMAADRLFWPDILAAIDGADRAIPDGGDPEGDPKYRVPGEVLDGRTIEIVCVVKSKVVLVTVYALKGKP